MPIDKLPSDSYTSWCVLGKLCSQFQWCSKEDQLQFTSYNQHWSKLAAISVWMCRQLIKNAKNECHKTSADYLVYRKGCSATGWGTMKRVAKNNEQAFDTAACVNKMGSWSSNFWVDCTNMQAPLTYALSVPPLVNWQPSYQGHEGKSRSIRPDIAIYGGLDSPRPLIY